MNNLYKILLLILLSAAGFLLISVMINLMIWAGTLNSSEVPQGFLEKMIQKASFVWMGAVVIGIISLFIQKSWRIALLLCPLILPPLFTLTYIIIQG